MDSKKLNLNKIRVEFFAFPLILLLAASFSYIIDLARSFSPSVSIPAITFHCLFILSLSAVSSNVMMEIFLTQLSKESKSSIDTIVYGERRFMPIRATVFSSIFIVAYILLTQIVSYQSSLQCLILIIPSVAIFLNAPHFISNRLCYVGGKYIIYKGQFHVVFSYYVNDDGQLVVIDERGEAIDIGVRVGVNAADTGIDIKKLEAEFEKNRLYRRDSSQS